MYRFPTLLSQPHLVLVRKKLSDGSCAALVVMRAPVRRYAKEHFTEVCPDPPKLRKSRKLLYGVIGATLLTGVGISYAKNSKRTRDWLETNVPWASNIVGIVYQENETYAEFALKHLERAKVNITGFLFGWEGIEPMDFQTRPEQDLEKDAEIGFAPKTYQLPKPQLEPLYKEPIEDGQAEVDIQATLVQTERCDPEEPLQVNITRDVLQLEKDLFKSCRSAIDNYKQATKLTNDFNKTLHRIVESPPNNPALFLALKGLRTERDKTAKEAHDAAATARCAAAELERMIKTNSIPAPPENLTRTRRFIEEFRHDLSDAEDKYKAELKKADITDKYWNKIEAARTMFMTELQGLFPGIDLCARTLDVRGDIDLFIVFCLNQVQSLQNAIAEMQTTLEEKVQKAVECMDEQSVIEAKAQEIILKERLAREMDYQKKSLKMMGDAHRKHKEDLLKQYEVQERVAAQKIARLEADIMAKANRTASEEVEKERVKFKKELAAMAGKIKAIEQTLKQRAAAEEEARRSQSIWAAAEALLQTTRRNSCTAKVDNELLALEKAGEKDKLVQTVLKGIPPEAREKGIVTERALKERFDMLEKTAAKVALVGRTGGSLPLYFMSWMQSKLLFQKFASIPQNELDNMPTDFTQLDTFDIMHRARYFMDRGDLGAALRYVNLLQGAPRAAASCWVEEARSHLEVKQAAETVMAHASLSGMLYS